MKQKLSRASKRALDTLVAKAKNWGWSQDQGSAAAAEADRAEFIKAYGRLQRRLLKLEKQP